MDRFDCRGRTADGRSYDAHSLRVYLECHVDVDAGRHAPLARRLITEICDEDPARWAEARSAALPVLAARRTLWDAIAARGARGRPKGAGCGARGRVPPR